MLYKDWQFLIYMKKYGRTKIKEEMNKLISSSCLKKQVTNKSQESFKSFLYVKVNRKYPRPVLYTWSLICICIDSSETIIENPDLIDFHGISFLRNNMTKPLLLEDRITSQHNYAIITVLALGMLYYVQSKHSNIVQKVNIQFVFAFANNVPKRFAESFHQMDLFVSYKSLCCDLQSNAKAVIKETLEKIQTDWLFILYNNMNFYKNIRDQSIYNGSNFISYTARYIYFIKTLNGIKNPTDSWDDEYIDSSQVDKKLVYQLRKSNFELKQANEDHQLAAV